MFDESIKLRRLTIPDEEVDEYGNLLQPQTTDTDVYAEVLSVGYKEFYEAAASGYKPEIKFKIADCSDYNGEQQIVYDGEVYDVIRTYRAPRSYELEITCAKGVV